MTRLIIPTAPEEIAPTEPPQPFTPEYLSKLSEEERKSPEMQEFGRRMSNSGAAYVTWFVWRYQSKVLETPFLPRQGSMFFLDCGRGPFAVTAGHVFEQFVEDQRTQRIRSCQIGNIGFNPEERLIAHGKDLGLDIATFRVSPEEIAATGKKIVQGTDGAWPPPPNRPNEGVFFGGFPGCERDSVGTHEMVFGLHSAITPLTSFTDHQLCCQLEREHWMDVRGLGLPPEGYDLGGISGGPMLAPVFTDGAWGWRLVGVISEAVSIEGFERVTAVRAHFILPDGRLSR
ncbi:MULTISPECIES: hypothetical protein [unclassified Bradyrhizobium]|uniref:hypothetical protein n=1 Tax=unclassified Bradyrhizobium TaxID=2631580 RepID=UPI0028EF4FF7|nr:MULTISPECIES: hypothetical protein [unclassified Bradyrhizobium]